MMRAGVYWLRYLRDHYKSHFVLLRGKRSQISDKRRNQIILHLGMFTLCYCLDNDIYLNIAD
jgi:hypothetical protein